MSVMEAYNPATVGEALTLLGTLKEKKARVIAGGTDVMVFLYERKLRAAHLIDITGLKELGGVREEGEHLTIGPLLTHAEAMENELIKRYAPLLALSCSKVGSPQIRNRGTIGGNVCTGSPAGDTLPALALLDARFTLSSARGTRELRFPDFFAGPQKVNASADELLTAIRIEKMGSDEHFAFERLGLRKALSVTKASVAARAVKKDGKLEKVRISLGSVSAVVKRAIKAEAVLEGKAFDRALLEKAVNAIREDATPIDDVRSTAAYRTYVVGALLKRFLEPLL
jgi:xanthine dehydrogenase FAD-binding subunit